jgi:adenylate cyclase
VIDDVDFAAEGLLGELEGRAREGRAALLRELLDDGVTLGQLRAAVAEDRLALLPVGRMLGGERRYSAREIAEQTGVPPDLLVEALAAAGLPRVSPSERRLTEADRAAAERLRVAIDNGLAADRIVDVNRVIGRAMAQVAAALRSLGGETLHLRADDTEDVVAARYAAAAQALLPTLGPTLEHALAVQLREVVRGDEAACCSNAIAGRELAIAFADLVGFTWLGGRVPAQELGRVARRLDELARAVLQPPVRLVKLVGDAVMLASPDPAPLLFCALSLVEAAAAEGDGFPRLRAGIALGDAHERDGDIYGNAVNVASRLTAIARPGSVLTDDRVHDAVGRQAGWSFAGERRIKGLDGELRLFRARRLSEPV